MEDESASGAKVNSPARRYSRPALLSFPAGLLGVFLPAPFSMLLGGIAMLLAGAARRELRKDTSLRGTAPALLGFLLGLGVLAVQVGPLLLMYLAVLLDSLVP
jgi:hypothetical protein